ncbi:hypothetical protein Tco_0250272, partial [Tanacetum coccineum]
PASVDFDFCNELVMKRLRKTIRLMDALAKINDPQCELLLLNSCTGISRLYFTMRTCPPSFFKSAQRSFDVALRSSLGRIVTVSGPGFESADLQTKLLRHTSIVSPVPIFDDAMSVFNSSMKTDLLSNPNEIVAPKLMKKMADIYFIRVTKNAESTFSLSPRQVALWTFKREDHTSDWLRTVPIFGLVQTMNGDIYRDHDVSCTGIIGIKHCHNAVRDTLVDICYHFGISSGKEVDIGLDGGRDKPLSPADMLLYSWDRGLDVHLALRYDVCQLFLTWMNSVIEKDFVPRHNLVHDILVDMCSKVGIMVRKETLMGFLSEDGKDLRPVNLLLFNWIQGKDACVDVTSISSFAGTGVNSYAPGVALHNAVEKKMRRYEIKCADNRYKFIPFDFSTFGEFDKDALNTLSRIRSLSISHSNNPKSGSFFIHRAQLSFDADFCSVLKRTVTVPNLRFGDWKWRLSTLPFLAVWDCDGDKASGPDGFSFKFFWDLVENDVVANAKTVSDFCPISLIGCQYKIIGKLLANRIRVVTGDCVNPVQSAFIKGRNILDGPLILNEVISCWNKGCLHSARSLVLVNGSPTDEFELHRGLRQGDSLSPFLFILAMEELLYLIGECSGLISNLSHLFRCFFLVSRLRINIHKSLVIGIGVLDDEVSYMANIIGCGTSKLPLKYLGVPVGCNMSRSSNWNAIIQKFYSKLSSWKARLLSVGGRLTLIRSVLNSLPIYYLSIYQVPSSVRKKLEAMRNSFFIGGLNTKLLVRCVVPISMTQSFVPSYFLNLLTLTEFLFANRLDVKIGLLFSSLSDRRDHWVWSFGGNEGFSVASVRGLVDLVILNNGHDATPWN